jgi:TolB-like protein/Tfp pilus assembly protein PilF/predicted Ser/Thr protein kinase
MEPGLLADLAVAVADGTPVNWDALESGVMTPAERKVIAQLRALASVRSVARSSTHDVAESSITESADATGVIHATATAVTRTATPSTWRHLTLLELVGRGGFGVVYRAWDSRLDKEVALKLIPAGTTLLDAAIGGEARRLARVRHPNVVTIHGADNADSQFGLWMEFVRGRTLRQIVEERGPFGAHEALTLGAEVARALAAVHAAGLVHRDLKAHNVMREDGGRVVLMDFGAGDDQESTAPRRMAGTPVYMAPELFADQRATPQSDIYSLGVLLFYLVTGKYPVSGRTWAEVGASHSSSQRLLLRDLRPDLPAAFVECVEAMTAPDPSKRIQTAGAAEAVLQRVLVGANPRRRWGIVAAAAALVVGVMAIGANLGSIRARFWGAPAVQSIAVLPMANLSGDAGRDYFVDGMHHQLIAELSRISAVRVTDRTSVMGYKQTTKRLNEIARELGVEAVLESSVVLSGSNLRVTAALIRAADGRRLWFNSYDKSITEALTLQAELTRDLASGIRLALTTEELRDLQQTFQASLEAQDLYLKGRALQSRFQHEGCALLERAVKIEEKYALAWASLSRCYTLMENNGVLSPADAAPKVKEAALKAIGLDASLAEAHVALANAQFRVDWNWRAAWDSFERAIAFNRSFSLARDQYARFLAAAGRTDEALDQARRAVQSDPQTADARRTLGLILFYQRRYPEALASADEGVAFSPSLPGAHVVRGRTLAAMGQYDEAIASMEKALSISDDGGGLLAELGRIYAAAGKRDQALAILQRLPGPPGPDGFVLTQDAGYILAALGRSEEALTRLEQAVSERSSRILYLRVDPRVDSLRDHPRFKALLVRIGGLD